MKSTSKEFYLDEITGELLNHLKDRPKEIIIRRFGLDGKAPKILNEIGQEFGITRERVRQIECDSFKRLRLIKKSQSFKELIDIVRDVISSSGGFYEKRKLKERLKKDITQKERNQLMFVLNGSNRLKYQKGTLALKGFWFIEEKGLVKKISEVHELIVKHIKKTKNPHTLKEIMKYVKNPESEKALNSFFDEKYGEIRLRMILEMSQTLEQNILEEWGLKNWKIISERGSREKALLILKKHEKPMHFKEITDLINNNWDDKKALPQTVHNELIKDDKFILVGRGIYGLSDWDFLEGTVKELVIDFLKKQSDPMDRDEIISHIKSKKQVKKATILVTLANKDIFGKDEEGFYFLKYETAK